MSVEEQADAFIATLLGALTANGSIASSLDIAGENGVDHQEVVVRAIKTLEAAEYVTTEKRTFDVNGLTDEGVAMLASGRTPEMALFQALTEEGVETKALEASLGKEVVQIGMGPNMKNKWAEKKGSLIIRKANPGQIPLSLSHYRFSALLRVYAHRVNAR